jgi:GNAT superfamily N-acetyltransferase
MVNVFEYRDGAPGDDVICGQIRAAAAIASPVYARLPAAQEFLGDQGPQPLSSLRRIMAMKDDEVVGFTDFNPLDGYVKMLFVLPVWQGHGIAGELLARVAEASEAPLNLRTQAVNDGALAFYLGHGFKIVDGAVEADWHGARVVWLTLRQEGAS